QDWAIARTAAEVASEEIFYLLFGRRLMLLQIGMHVHNETGSAETALRSIVDSDAMLHRIEPVVQVPNAFNRRHLTVGDAAQVSQAGMYRPMIDTTGGATRNHHRAGTTTALLATNLGAGQTAVMKILDKERRGRRILYLYLPSIQPKLQLIAVII